MHPSDPNAAKLHRLTKLYSAPEYVKEASAIDDTADLPALSFADPVSRKLPRHTKAAVWHSYALIQEGEVALTKSAKDEAIARLRQAADYCDITADLNEIDRLINVKQAVDDADSYALTIDGERRYPLRNAGEIKAASAYLQTHVKEMKYELRQKYAAKVLHKAGELGVQFAPADSSFLERQAGYGYGSKEAVAAACESRATALRRRSPETAAELNKTASLVRMGSMTGNDDRVKLTGILEQLDRAYGLDKEGFAPPEDVIFSILPKEAQSFVDDHFTMSTGKTYRVADLYKVSADSILDLFGDKTAAEVTAGGIAVQPQQLAEKAAAFNMNEAALFDRLLANAGVAPAYVLPAQSLERKEFIEIAAIM